MATATATGVKLTAAATCGKCGSRVLKQEIHRAGFSLSCLNCGHCKEYAPDGQPWVPRFDDEPPVEERYETAREGHVTKVRGIKALACSYFYVHTQPWSHMQSARRASRSWSLEPSSPFFVAVYHAATGRHGKRNIVSVEILGGDAMVQNDVDDRMLRQLCRMQLAEMLGVPVGGDVNWGIESWGSMERMVQGINLNDTGGRNVG